MAIALPFNFGYFGYGHAFASEFLFEAQWDEGLFLPALVEVFVKAVEEEIEVFFCVLLSVQTPFWIQTGAKTSECHWSDGLDVSFPEATYEIGVYFWHDAIGSFPVLLGEVPPSIVEEKLGKRDGSEKTLNCGVHITSHTEVDEAGSRKLQVVRNGSRCVKRRLCG